MSSVNTTEEPRRCLGCRHLIRSAESLATGYGAGCRTKHRKAAKTADLSVWTPAQIAEAEQALADGAVVPSTRAAVFHVVSSDGSEVYRTHRNGCTCTNGLRTLPPRPCWHRYAVTIVLATSAPAPVPALAPAPIALPAAPVAAPVDAVWAALEAAGALDLVPAF